MLSANITLWLCREKPTTPKKPLSKTGRKYLCLRDAIFAFLFPALFRQIQSWYNPATAYCWLKPLLLKSERIRIRFEKNLGIKIKQSPSKQSKKELQAFVSVNLKTIICCLHLMSIVTDVHFHKYHLVTGFSSLSTHTTPPPQHALSCNTWENWAW